jgi:cysteine-rich repeat protein
MRRKGSVLRKVGVLLVVGLVAGALADAAMAHSVRFGGSLTVVFQPETNVFKGRVSSSNDRCERGRRVVVFRVVSGPDQAVASDRTDSEGRWRLVYNPRSDDYYAKAQRKNISPEGHSHICRAITTSTFNIPPRCGNGWTEAGEACDDGNRENGDGCSATCQVEGPVAQLAAREPGENLKAPCAKRQRASGSVV